MVIKIWCICKCLVKGCEIVFNCFKFIIVRVNDEDIVKVVFNGYIILYKVFLKC